MYSITEGFSPILCCRPDVITLGNPFDTRVPDYSSNVFFVFFSKNEEEAIPPGGKKIFRDIKSKSAVEFLNLLILVRLSRKFDASYTIVKICWSLLRSAGAISPGDRWRLLI